MSSDPMDFFERIVFAPWEYAEGKGRLIGWPLMAIGAIWVMVLLIPIGLPSILISVIMDMDQTLRKPRK